MYSLGIVDKRDCIQEPSHCIAPKSHLPMLRESWPIYRTMEKYETDKIDVIIKSNSVLVQCLGFSFALNFLLDLGKQLRIP